MSNELAKKAIAAAQKTFDSVALKLATPTKNYVTSYVELTRADDYSSSKRFVDKWMEVAKKRGLPEKFLPKDPTAVADRFSRAVGSMESLQSFGAAFRKGKKVAGYAGVGIVVAAVTSPETASNFISWIQGAGLGALVPVVAVAATYISFNFVKKSLGIHGMHKDAKFSDRAEKSKDDKKYLPDFSPETVDVIKQGLAQQQSEALMVSPVTPDQQKAVKKISKTLREEFFVPDHLATHATLTLLVEKEGNSKAVTAMLNSRHIEQSVIDRFGIDPLATYGGKRPEPVKPVTQLPAPTPAEVDSSPSP